MGAGPHRDLRSDPQRAPVVVWVSVPVSQGANGPAVPGWEGQQRRPGGEGLVPRPGGVGVLGPPGGQHDPVGSGTARHRLRRSLTAPGFSTSRSARTNPHRSRSPCRPGRTWWYYAPQSLTEATSPCWATAPPSAPADRHPRGLTGGWISSAPAGLACVRAGRGAGAGGCRDRRRFLRRRGSEADRRTSAAATTPALSAWFR